jgi:hypothetical protein
MPEEQDKLLQQMMINVVTKGTGTQAQIPNVQVGGKTGTADNQDANGNPLAPHAWFTGFALDANHPIAIAVVLENAGVLIAATLLTLRAEWAILFNALTFQPDAQIHTFWMRRFQDPGLFTDPLTSALVKAGYVPLGLQTLYRIASYAVDPVTFGPWLAVVLAPLSAWLVFLIVRQHTDWWPAAWMGAALFMLPVSSLRFSGGHARAFAQPVVLLHVSASMLVFDALFTRSPTATHDEPLGHDTPFNSLTSAPEMFCAVWIAQLVPFHLSMSTAGGTSMPVLAPPTAVQAVAALHDTPDSWA